MCYAADFEESVSAVVCRVYWRAPYLRRGRLERNIGAVARAVAGDTIADEGGSHCISSGRRTSGGELAD